MSTFDDSSTSSILSSTILKGSTASPEISFASDRPSRKMNIPGPNIFLSNLPSDMSKKDMVVLLEKYGSIKSCVLLTDEEGRTRRSGLCRFKTVEQAEMAISGLNGFLLPNSINPIRAVFSHDQRLFEREQSSDVTSNSNSSSHTMKNHRSRSRSRDRKSYTRRPRSSSRHRRNRSKERRSSSRHRRNRSKERRSSSRHRRNRSKERRSSSRHGRNRYRKSKSPSGSRRRERSSKRQNTQHLVFTDDQVINQHFNQASDQASDQTHDQTMNIPLYTSSTLSSSSSSSSSSSPSFPLFPSSSFSYQTHHQNYTNYDNYSMVQPSFMYPVLASFPYPYNYQQFSMPTQ